MTSGPVVLWCWRARTPSRRTARSWAPPTRPTPPPGTIRKDFATDVEKNTVHGSDSPENAKIEIAYFFRETEITPYTSKR